MFAIIIGCNPSSYLLAKSLLTSGHEICMLEKDSMKVDFLWDEMGSMIIHGDATQTEYLEYAGISRPPDIVFSLTSDDSVNMLVSQIAKKIYHVPRTIASVNDPTFKPLFHLSGITEVIDINDLVLNKLEDILPDNPIKHIIDFAETAHSLITIQLPEDSKIVMEKTAIANLELPDSSFICLVMRKGQPMRPTNNFVLEYDDQAIIVAPQAQENHIYELLTGV
jgi:trk system potassium uptake protein TrkA